MLRADLSGNHRMTIIRDRWSVRHSNEIRWMKWKAVIHTHTHTYTNTYIRTYTHTHKHVRQAIETNLRLRIGFLCHRNAINFRPLFLCDWLRELCWVIHLSADWIVIYLCVCVSSSVPFCANSRTCIEDSMLHCEAQCCFAVSHANGGALLYQRCEWLIKQNV